MKKYNKLYDIDDNEYNKVCNEYSNNYGLNIGINTSVSKIYKKCSIEKEIQIKKCS